MTSLITVGNEGTPRPTSGAHRAWLREQIEALLAFGRHAGADGGGAWWLDVDGEPVPSRGLHTWVTARTVHVHALGHLLGIPGSRPLAEQALAGLTGRLRDRVHGGWFSSVDADGRPAPGKQAYDHAFVVLAASSATVAGLPGAADLLSESGETFLSRFWDDHAGRCVDQWDTDFSRLHDYRGMNANMHAVEAMLAAGDATGDPTWFERAGRIAQFAVAQASRHDWRLPEHYDAQWSPVLDLNVDNPEDQFRPYGATVGHGFEWARLLLHLETAAPTTIRGAGGQPDLLEAAQALFARASADGWSVDGSPGFVYTTDWEGHPVVHQRLHWVAAEAIGAAAVLHARTADARYADRYATWWEYVVGNVIDHERGSWHHELDRHNTPASTLWWGKPDLYHAVQATILPKIPITASIAGALAAD